MRHKISINNQKQGPAQNLNQSQKIDKNNTSDKFCQIQDISQHKKDFAFCYSCKVAFCRKCFPQKNKDHLNHPQFESAQNFKRRIQKFKNILKRQEFNEVNDQYFSFTKDQSSDNILLKLTNQKYRKWLIKIKFWEYQNQKQLEEKIKKLQAIFLRVEESQIVPPDDRSQNAIIDWGKITGTNGDSIFDQMYIQASNEKQRLMKEKNIIDLLIEAYSSFNEKSKMQSLQKIKEACLNYPNQTILFLAHLYLLQLNQTNQQQWMPILKKVTELSPSLKESHLEAFIQSHKYWVPIGREQKESRIIRFVDPSSGNIYKLSNPIQYTQILNKGLLKDKKCSIIQAAKGLGLIAQERYGEGIKCLVEASGAFQNESFKMNKLFLLQKNRQKIPVQSILQQLENKSKHYIINAIKYFKANNDIQRIVQCCSVLKEQKNQNTFTQIELMKALMKLGQVQKASEIRNEISQDKINDELRQRLNRQLIYAQARNFVKQKDYEIAQKKCLSLIKGKQSPSALYSLASVYYNQQMWQQAQVEIDKAIKLKNCKKYLKLKFYILLMKKQLEEARKLLKNLPQSEIDQKIKEMLIQLG